MPACGTKTDLHVKHKPCFVNAICIVIATVNVLATITVTLRNVTKQNKIKISFDFALRLYLLFFAFTIILVNAVLYINIL